MNIALWEWNFDVVLVQRVVDALHDVADGIDLPDGVYPTKQVEVDAIVAKLREDHLYSLQGIQVAMMHFHYGILDELGDVLHIGSIGHTEGNQREHVAVILGEVLVVLGEELGVGEGNHRTVDGLN